VGNNTATNLGPDILGTALADYDLVENTTDATLIGAFNITGVDPMLGPLQNNGGPTFTHALLVGSLAIDMGNPNFIPPPNYDQRGPGFDRVVNSRIDIGAFEVQPTPPTGEGGMTGPGVFRRLGPVPRTSQLPRRTFARPR
jgi:hypothetical protein